MRNNWPLVIFIFFVVAVFTFFTPFQLINSDSVVGFDTLKGPGWTGKMNTYFVYDEHLNKFLRYFCTWWSPGQYVMPGLLMKLFGLPLGYAITLLNSLCMAFGTIGYALVFKKYQFKPLVIFFSVILILFSGSTLLRYYSYQGGESLNFLFFPYIFLLQGIFTKKYLNYIIPGVLVIVGFFLKLQLLIIVPPLLHILDITSRADFDNIFDDKNKPKRWTQIFGRITLHSVPIMISIVGALTFIYFDFISRGNTPASKLLPTSFKWIHVLVPFSSPLTSLYAGEAGFNLIHSIKLKDLYLAGCSILVLLALVIIGKNFSKAEPIKKKYIMVALTLYAVSVLAFSYLYIEGSNVDYNTRHFKLSSFLMYPLIFDILLKKFNVKIQAGIVALLVLVAIGNHLRLTKIWLANTQVTASKFRLLKNDMPLSIKNLLDAKITSPTIVVSPYETRYAIDNKLILPVRVEFNGGNHPAIPDMGYPVIYVDSTAIVRGF